MYLLGLFIILLMLQVSFYSCSTATSCSRLESALVFAGDNREELEKVLSHYRDDSLKFKAAIFLIENMPYYYTYKGEVLDSFYEALNQVCDSGRYDKQRFASLTPFPYSSLKKEYDARVIWADYLIKDAWHYSVDFNGPHLPTDLLVDKRIGDCEDMSEYALYIMRSVGLPVAMDSYIFSPTKLNGHCWNALLDTTGLTVSFFNTDFSPDRSKQVGYVKGKVYRHCYALQHDRMLPLQKGFRIPTPLNNYFLKDVSVDYFSTGPLYVDCDNMNSSLDGSPVWLATFFLLSWETAF